MKIGVPKPDVSYCDGNVTDKSGNFWQVIEVLDDDSFLCAKVQTAQFFTVVPSKSKNLLIDVFLMANIFTFFAV